MSKFSEDTYRRRAREDRAFADDNIFSFDDKPEVSMGGDDGAYVHVWVWIADEDIECAGGRYLTTMSEDGCIEAWRNPLRPQVLIEADGCVEWVWQWAKSSDEAIAQHVAKHDEWTADIDAGRELKETY